MAKSLKSPQQELYRAAVEARLHMGADGSNASDAHSLAPHDAVAPALLQFIAEPPTRSIRDLDDVLSRRAILERGTVPKEMYATVIGPLNFEEVSPSSEEEGVKNAAIDALKQEERHGLRPEPVTDAEWSWAEDYDACLRDYMQIGTTVEEAQSVAFAALQQIEERYGFRFTGAV